MSRRGPGAGQGSTVAPPVTGQNQGGDCRLFPRRWSVARWRATAEALKGSLANLLATQDMEKAQGASQTKLVRSRLPYCVRLRQCWVRQVGSPLNRKHVKVENTAKQVPVREGGTENGSDSHTHTPPASFIDSEEIGWSTTYIK